MCILNKCKDTYKKYSTYECRLYKCTAVQEKKEINIQNYEITKCCTILVVCIHLKKMLHTFAIVYKKKKIETCNKIYRECMSAVAM